VILGDKLVVSMEVVPLSAPRPFLSHQVQDRLLPLE
jgi:hypothetical protein